MKARLGRGGGFRRLEEVAAASGGLIPHPGRGLHLQALAAWRAAVGERLRRRSRVARLEGGVMTVEVPDAAWGEPISRLEAQILGRVRERMGDAAPRRIQVRVSERYWRPASGPMPRSRAAESEPEARPTPTTARREGVVERPEIVEHIHADEIEVGDETLRRAIHRVANRYLSRSLGTRRRP